MVFAVMTESFTSSEALFRQIGLTGGVQVESWCRLYRGSRGIEPWKLE